MILVLLAVWHGLSFHVPRWNQGRNPCEPIRLIWCDDLAFIDQEVCHDSTAAARNNGSDTTYWKLNSRWGARGLVHVAQWSDTVYTGMVAWPDTALPRWYRVVMVDTAGNRSCPSNVVSIP